MPIVALAPMVPALADPARAGLDPWAGVLPSPAFIVVVLVLLLGAATAARLLWRAAIPSPGFATAWQIRRYMSAAAARRSLGLTRPSLAGTRRVPVEEYSYRIGQSLSPFMTIRGGPEDSALFIGPPGVGKSAVLGDITVDAPGAVVVTTSKISDVDTTMAARSQVGPVVVFNPQGLGGVPSTLRINPVKGCAQEKVAMRRGAMLLYGSRRPGDERGMEDFFRSTANEVLRALLMAADLGGRTLLDVQRWANDPNSPEAARILQQHQAPRMWIETLVSRQTVTDRTRDGIYSTLATTLSWLSNPAAVETVTPAPGQELDLEAFLAQRGTLYMVAEDARGGSAGGIASLFTLVISDIVEAAIDLADRMPGRRLDPWLTLCLDEVATICPVPLDQWINTHRAHGILDLVGIQSKAQLYERWGRAGGDSIWNAAAFTVAFGGLKSAEDLRELAVLCGEREVVRRSVQHTASGPIRSEHEELRPVLAPHRIRNLRRGRALVLYRGCPPVIVRIRKVWRRRDVRRALDVQQRPRTLVRDVA